MKKVFVAGGASYDSIIYVDDFPEVGTNFSNDFHETAGSTGVGKSMNLGQLGFDVTFHAMIGDDSYGDKIKEKIKDKNVNFLYDKDPKGTERHINIINNRGERMGIYVSYATFEPEINYQRMEEVVKNSDYLVINIINYARNFIPIAQEYRKEIWTDIHDYDGKSNYHKDFIQAADYLFMSSESMADYKEFMKEKIKEGKKLVLCTKGKEGAIALTKEGKWIEVPIIEDYEMADTNGAGDSFFAGFLYGFANGYSIKESMQFGTVTAGLCITSYELAYSELSIDFLKNEYRKYY